MIRQYFRRCRTEKKELYVFLPMNLFEAKIKTTNRIEDYKRAGFQNNLRRL